MPKIFRNVRVYINGFLDDTTDIEMKRIIIQYGGQVVCVQVPLSLDVHLNHRSTKLYSLWVYPYLDFTAA
jgi:hypothetical protein